MWHAAPVTAAANPDLEALVESWSTVPDLAERAGVRLSDVRGWIEDRLVLAARVGARHVVAVPSAFVDERGPLAVLRGTFTVLADGGLSDEEILTWLFTRDETLPVPGTPMDNLLAGHKTEIRRRAMELAI